MLFRPFRVIRVSTCNNPNKPIPGYGALVGLVAVEGVWGLDHWGKDFPLKLVLPLEKVLNTHLI